MRASDDADQEQELTRGDGDFVTGRCGSLAIRASDISALKDRLTSGTRRLRIAYFPGVADFGSASVHWAKGEHDPNYASIPYGTQFCDLAEALDAKTIVFDRSVTEEACGPVPDQRVLPVPELTPTALVLRQRLNHFRRMRRVRQSINAFGADISVIGERTDWFAVRGTNGLIIRSNHTNPWHVDRAVPSLSDRLRLVDQIGRGRSAMDAAVSVSGQGAQQIQWLTGGKVPCFVSTPQSQATPIPVPAPFGEKPRLFFLGRAVFEKGIFDLLSVAMRMKADHPDLELVIAGDGEAYARLKAELELRGITDWATAPGWLSQARIDAEMRKASLVVVPTRSAHREGQPRVLAEAHMAGRPAVASTLCETVARDSTLFFEAEDLDSLEAALRSALFDPETRDQLRVQAQKNRSMYTDRRLSWGSQLFAAMMAAAGVAPASGLTQP